MSDVDPVADTVISTPGRVRPVSMSKGALAFAAAVAAGLFMVTLTGAASVVVVLASVAAWLALSSLTGWWSLRKLTSVSVTTPAWAAVDETVQVDVMLDAVSGPADVVLSVHGDVVGAATLNSSGQVVMSVGSRQVVDTVDVTVRSAGVAGLVWWRRRQQVVLVRPLQVTPPPVAGGVRVVEVPASSGDMAALSSQAAAGEVVGVRPWREGDAVNRVHWPSSLRSSELTVIDVAQPADVLPVFQVSSDSTLERQLSGLHAASAGVFRSGSTVRVTLDGGPVVELSSPGSLRDWMMGLPDPPPTPRRRVVEAANPLSSRSRWLGVAAVWVAVAMLRSPAGFSLAFMAAVTVGLAAAGFVSSRWSKAPLWLTLLLGAAAVGTLGYAVSGVGEISGLVSLLRGPLAQVLVVLTVLHAFECRDGRAARFELAVTAVMVMYASALRTDASVVWWLTVWMVLFAAGNVASAKPPLRSPKLREPDRAATPRKRAVGAVGVAVWVAVTVLVLSFVPVPQGPAQLTLPALTDDPARVTSPGGLAAADGSLTEPGVSSGSDRSPNGVAGGYRGFSESLDTSVRGELSEEVVFRVRASEPAFWRGQTFGEFDGRFWTADTSEQGRGEFTQGPQIAVFPALGDVRPTVQTDRFVQTFFVTSAGPSLLFHAYRPVSVAFDGGVWTRPDGALRPDTVMSEGSVYTVVSARPQVTSASLRAQGDVAEALSPDRADELASYLEVPAATSERTVSLADELFAGVSTFDGVRAAEAWLEENVTYDLDAPVPADGVDAVDDFLFESRRGFCEQIASALAVMLRTQGVPARLVTGYVSGDRDPVSGVFNVRAKHAHAWVEVWFPESGWEAFDPTADVPLAGEVDPSTVGLELLGAFAKTLSEHMFAVVSGVVLLLAALLATRRIRRSVFRRRRGRWGVLFDEFAAAAAGAGVDVYALPLPAAAGMLVERVFDAGEVEGVTSEDVLWVAAVFDAAVCDPAWVDDPVTFARAAQVVAAVSRQVRTPRRRVAELV